jgi:hypothetical protein
MNMAAKQNKGYSLHPFYIRVKFVIGGKVNVQGEALHGRAGRIHDAPDTLIVQVKSK